MNLLLVLPIVIPLTTGALLLVAPRRPTIQCGGGLAGAVALLAAASVLFADVYRGGIRVSYVAGWPAPFGITLVADLFSAIMVWIAGAMGAAVALYSVTMLDEGRQTHGFYSLFHFLLMGVCGAFLTGDLFNLYVWFEVMLIASFVLLSLGGERAQLDGSIKYVVLNLVASAIFLAAIGILYGAVGTLNMADLARKLAESDHDVHITILAMLFLVAFGIKAAVFPLFFWLPASYHTPPAAISAIFAGLLTKVGVYALVRVFTLLFVHDVSFTHTLLLIISGLTMISGVLGAIAQDEFRRVLSFHIVSQIGYMVLGLALLTPLSVAGSVFYIVHHIIVKTNLFLIGGVAERHGGTAHLAGLGGLYTERPMLAGMFVVSAFSLAGFPPLSGFFAKLILVRAGLETGNYAIVAVALAVGLLTLYSMSKIWREAFWKSEVESQHDGTPSEPERWTFRAQACAFLPIICLAGMTVSIGLGAGPLLALATSAAGQLLDQEGYVQAVLEP